MPPRNLSELFSHIAKSEGYDDPPQPSLPMMEAQRERLETLVKTSNLVPTFIRGQQVHYEAACGPYKAHPRQNLYFIFWRYLDEDSEEDQFRVSHMSSTSASTLPHVDCMIAYYDGDSVTFDLACSTLLRLGPSPE